MGGSSISVQFLTDTGATEDVGAVCFGSIPGVPGDGLALMITVRQAL